MRELKEELGYEVSGGQLPRLETYKFADPKTKVFANIYFLEAEIRETDLKLQPSEVDAVEYWSIEDIESKITNPDLKITPDSIECYRLMRSKNHF